VIDPRLLRDDPERVRAAQRRRGQSDAIVDELRAADEIRRTAISEYERLRAEQKSLGRQVAGASGDERANLLARTKQLAGAVRTAEATQNAAETAFTTLMSALPNVADERAPAGGEDDFVVLEEHGAVRDFAAEGWAPRDHLELGTCSRRSTWSAAPRCRARGSTS